MNKFSFFLFALVLFGITSVSAQVTVGSTATPNATLDVVGKPSDTAAKDGVIIPRLTVSQLQNKLSAYGQDQNSALVYISDKPTSTLTGKMAKIKDAGFYYFKYVNGTDDLWLPLGTGNVSWYYLPSTKIDVQLGTNKELDVFRAYMEQVSQTADFTNSGSFSGGASTSYTDRGYTIKSESGAPDIKDMLAWETTYQADAFYYYVVGFDERVFENISFPSGTPGKMKYDVKGTADEATFINIVIVKK